MKRLFLLLMLTLIACGDEAPTEDSTQYATQVVDFKPGEGAGYGTDDFPQAVLGPPSAKGVLVGSLDVLSLGVGGEITLSFSGGIEDGPGPDFIVFENSFWASNRAEDVFAELGQVGVSEDGEEWHWFDCDITPSEPGVWPGCAGWRPTLEFDTSVTPLDPAQTGGDPFDLSDVGLEHARFVRIRDLAESGVEPSAGFDLDAVGVVYLDD